MQQEPLGLEPPPFVSEVQLLEEFPGAKSQELSVWSGSVLPLCGTECLPYDGTSLGPWAQCDSGTLSYRHDVLMG